MKTERRYDIDWIRVLAFDILILYHVGMFFVPWGWHIKNNEIVEWMRWPMLFVNQWRIPILFVVSGMGTRFVLYNKTGKQYIRERLSRLLIPLIAGILLVIPPQVYIERLAEGQFSGSFIEFYPHFFNGVYPAGNFSWHHLWFLPYLLLMSILATPIFLNLRKGENKMLKWLHKKLDKSAFNLYLFAVPLFVVELFLEPFFPITHALLGDWYALASYSLLFIIGFVLISLGNSFWVGLNRIKAYTLITGIISFPLLLWLWLNYEVNIFIPIVKTINMWSWILTIFAFAAKFLNRDSKLIRYRNRAVYPFYILHQTITVICGFFLMNLNMHYVLKMLIMIVATFGISLFIYAFAILKIPILMPLFGVKSNKAIASRGVT
jgi:glucans biosynthesis protein C